MNTIYVNGTSLTPKVYGQSPDYGLLGTVAQQAAVVADATSINGSTVISLKEGGYGMHTIRYLGGKNLFSGSATGDFSFAKRYKLHTLASTQNIFHIADGAWTTLGPGISIYQSSPSGEMFVFMYDETQNVIFNGVSFGGTWVVDTWYDIIGTWDNTTRTLSLYQDASLMSSQVSAARYFGFQGTFMAGQFTSIMLGQSRAGIGSNLSLDEFIWFDHKLSAGEIAAYTGASRNSYYGYSATVADTWPSESNVRSTITWYQASVLKTGTMTLPAVGKVQTGQQFGAGGTEFTGTRDDADSTKVLDTESYGDGGTEITGTATIPANGDVRDGELFGVDGDGSEGTMTLPTAAQTQLGVQFGADGTEFTGTYVPSAEPNTVLIIDLPNPDYDYIVVILNSDQLEDESIIIIEDTEDILVLIEEKL